jgi:uncharacterized membrane protein YbhN (UPF0104 family)
MTALIVAGAAVVLAAPTVTGVPARLADACRDWIATAGALEFLSALGFVLVFKLVFAAPVSWRRAVPAALRGLGASTMLPGGGLIGPTVGAWSSGSDKPSLPQLMRSTVTFGILTNAPGAVALTALGTLLWLGLPAGPHRPELTIVPAVIAAALLSLTWRTGRSNRQSGGRSGVLPPILVKQRAALQRGIGEARTLTRARNWKLTGAAAYYACDNAVLWASFHAFGHPPQFGVVVMGYLIGSLAGAVPVPAGLGILDGGLIGALVLYGSPPAPTVAAVLLYRGISLSWSLALGTIGMSCGASGARHRRRPEGQAGRGAPGLTPVHGDTP